MSHTRIMKITSLILLLLYTLFSIQTQADDFGEGDLKFHISFVPIASNEQAQDFIGNDLPYTDYDYRIGKTEISIAQFLQARAADARISRPVVDYWNSEEAQFGVHAPVSNVNIIECFKFCNWLTSGDPYQGAYQLIQNTNPDNDTIDLDQLDYVDREGALAEFGTVYVVPTFFEWSKAAFYKPDGSGFSFYSNGAGTSNIHYYGHNLNVSQSISYYINIYGEAPRDVMFIMSDQDQKESDYRYYDSEGVEQTITPPKGIGGGWNSDFMAFPWEVGSSQREQNKTYDLFGNLGEYYEEIYDLNGRDFRVTASCWNWYRNLGGNSRTSIDRIEVFSTTSASTKFTYNIENAQSGRETVGFRVVALGAVPEASPMPEVESTITDGAAHLHWDSTVGRIYQMQYSNSLENPVWVNIGNRIHGSGGREFMVIPVDTEAERNRFYRVVDFD